MSKTSLKLAIKRMAYDSRNHRIEKNKWRDGFRDRKVNVGRALKRVHRLEQIKTKWSPEQNALFLIGSKLELAKQALDAERAKTAPKSALPETHPHVIELHDNRINNIRPTIRTYLLAYGFLRGRAYAHIEQRLGRAPRPMKGSKPKSKGSNEYIEFDYLECPMDAKPDFDHVWSVIEMYGFKDGIYLEYQKWRTAALKHLESQGWKSEYLT